MIENNLPLVTVIVPCYNHEKYVETCLDSIFRQTYQNIEVIVIDDCSSDNSAEVIKKLQTKYDFKFIEHQENWGLTKTLNDVIYNHTNGKYIKVIASDDYLTDDCVEVLTTEIERLGNEYAFVYAQVRHFIEKNGVIDLQEYVGNSCTVVELFEREENYIPAMSVLFDKNKFIYLGGFDDCYIEDYYMWLTFATKYKFQFVKHCVAFYRQGLVSAMHFNHVRMFSGLNYIQSKVFIQNNGVFGVDSYFQQIAKNYYYYNIQQIYKQLKDKNRLCALKKYFKMLPLMIYRGDSSIVKFWVKLILGDVGIGKLKLLKSKFSR
ncbi:MAG: glycosyltransferase [Burkholderiales bacterium]|nr:glycosyltransferase [Burkholderiales bacterium]